MATATGNTMPEWVHVWFWLRSALKVMTTLPQQERPPGNPEAMPMAAYEHFRNDWLAAGAPRADAANVLATTADALRERVPF